MTEPAQKQPAKNPLRTDIEGLIGLIETFSALLAKETAALKKSDFKAVDALQNDKKRLAREYGDQVQILCARQSEISTLDTATRKKLLAARGGFSVILDENLRALDAAKNSAKRLVNRILDIARKTVVEEKQTHYSAKGQAGAYKTASMSLSLDRKL